MPISAKAKLEGARDQLAGKEMEIGRYYLEKRDYTGAINRFKTVVTQYQTTRHVEEALERLTEAYMAIGIVGEAQTAAAVLGHNFPDSRWYKDAYNLVEIRRSRAERESGVLDQPGLQEGGSRLGIWLSMLARLSIRDIVLIERLDIEFARGLAVLTGETGAGKSILLDAFALALGGRGDAGLVRHGAEQGQVTAVFDVPKDHPATQHPFRQRPRRRIRRSRDDPPPRADAPTAAPAPSSTTRRSRVQTLKAVGSALVEIHGQHDERALVDAATHRRLLDAFAGLEKDVAALEKLWEARRTAHGALDEHRAGMERAAREADYLRHASDELKKLAPQDGEETVLANRRTVMMQGEKIAADLREAQEAVGGDHSPVAALVGGGAAAGAPRGQFAGAGRAGGEGDRYRASTRWKRPTSI